MRYILIDNIQKRVSLDHGVHYCGTPLVCPYTAGRLLSLSCLFVFDPVLLLFVTYSLKFHEKLLLSKPAVEEAGKTSRELKMLRLNNLKFNQNKLKTLS